LPPVDAPAAPSAANRFATSPVPLDPARVTFLLDGPQHRQRILQQVLWMRLDGLSISRISRATGMTRETIQNMIDCWQGQTEIVFRDNFSPLAVCSRREAGRKKI
jgi:hypothetical protein